MADGSHIEWTDATWNPITGCSVISPGCANCYAMRLAGTRLKDHPSRAGLTAPSKAGPVWTGEVRFNEEWLDQPLRWSKPRRIFVCAHGDLFHEAVPDEWIDRIFAVMTMASHHTFQVLTKRAERARDYLKHFDNRRADSLGEKVRAIGYRGPLECLQWPLPNLWLGVSVEDQARADERIPLLLDTPAAVRWISAEPLRGAINLRRLNTYAFARCEKVNALSGDGLDFLDVVQRRVTGIDWVVVGGESGRYARPMHPDWARQIRDDCTAAGVAFFFKQWGDWGVDEPESHCREFRSLTGEERRYTYRVGKRRAGRLLDGRTHDAMPRAA